MGLSPGPGAGWGRSAHGYGAFRVGRVRGRAVRAGGAGGAACCTDPGAFPSVPHGENPAASREGVKLPAGRFGRTTPRLPGGQGAEARPAAPREPTPTWALPARAIRATVAPRGPPPGSAHPGRVRTHAHPEPARQGGPHRHDTAHPSARVRPPRASPHPHPPEARPPRRLAPPRHRTPLRPDPPTPGESAPTPTQGPPARAIRTATTPHARPPEFARRGERYVLFRRPDG